MSRQEFLVNLVFLTIIGCLAYLIFEQQQKKSQPLRPPIVASVGDSADTETKFNPAAAAQKYPRLGTTPLFRPLIPTPTPSPTPAPTPTPTPNISNVLRPWKLISVMGNEASIENRAPRSEDDRFFDVKVGESRAADDGGMQRSATLKRTDENSDPPIAVFSLDGTTDEYIIRLGNDVPFGAPGQPGQPPR